MKSISVFGLGYVGTVTAACLAHQGNDVTGVDLSSAKVDMLEQGRSPIVEPQLNDLVMQAHEARRLHATSDAVSAIENSDISFLCVGTPSLRNGKLDLRSIEPVCREIGQALKSKDRFHLIVLRSTVLPGTTENVVLPALEQSSGKVAGRDFSVCVNPEFMREGTAVADFLQPVVTVIGANGDGAGAMLKDVYSWAPGRMLETSYRSAEMAKYVSNAWHAVKVAFANEVGTLAKELGVDAEAVFDLFASDTKLNISSRYLRPGFAFGGSCLPKDVRALTYRAKELDLKLPLCEAVLPSNGEHLQRATDMILSERIDNIGMLGLSFKAATDDLRESPHVELVKRLIGEGKHVRIWDDNVSLGRLLGSNRQYIEETIPHIGSLLSGDLGDVVKTADLIVIGSRSIGADAIRPYLRPGHVVVDLVNLEKDRRTRHPHAKGICW
jgi:GDP-mannose 6-dehydrogenase